MEGWKIKNAFKYEKIQSNQAIIQSFKQCALQYSKLAAIKFKEYLQRATEKEASNQKKINEEQSIKKEQKKKQSIGNQEDHQGSENENIDENLENKAERSVRSLQSNQSKRKNQQDLHQSLQDDVEDEHNLSIEMGIDNANKKTVIPTDKFKLNINDILSAPPVLMSKRSFTNIKIDEDNHDKFPSPYKKSQTNVNSPSQLGPPPSLPRSPTQRNSPSSQLKPPPILSPSNHYSKSFTHIKSPFSQQNQFFNTKVVDEDQQNKQPNWKTSDNLQLPSSQKHIEQQENNTPKQQKSSRRQTEQSNNNHKEEFQQEEIDSQPEKKKKETQLNNNILSNKEEKIEENKSQPSYREKARSIRKKDQEEQNKFNEEKRQTVKVQKTSEEMTNEIKERFVKFTSKMVYEHEVEELHHMNRSDYTSLLIRVFRSSIYKLTEGIKIIQLLSHSRRIMMQNISQQEKQINKQIKQMSEINQKNKSLNIPMDEEQIGHSIESLNALLSGYYDQVQQTNRSIQILISQFNFEDGWRLQLRYGSLEVPRNTKESLPMLSFNLHSYFDNSLKEVKSIYDSIYDTQSEQDEDENMNLHPHHQFLDYTTQDIEDAIGILKPLAEYFETNAITEFETLFYLFIEDMRELTYQFQDNFNRQQENISSLKKNYENLKNYYHQRYHKILDLQYQNVVCKQKLMYITDPLENKGNQMLYFEAQQVLKENDIQLKIIKDSLENKPIIVEPIESYISSNQENENENGISSNRETFDYLQSQLCNKVSILTKQYEGELRELKKVYKVVSQLLPMQQSIDQADKIKEIVEADIFRTEEDKQYQINLLSKQQDFIDQSLASLAKILDMAPYFRVLYSRLLSQKNSIQLIIELAQDKY